MKTAVVILNWNGKSLLEQFLPTVLACTPPDVEVWVADNASTDESIAYLQEHFPQIRLVTLDKNYGFAGGYNRALQRIEADVYVLLNSDVEVTSGWVERPLALLDERPEVAAVQPKILDHKNKEYFEYAGAAGGFLDRYGFPFCRGRIFDTLEKDSGQYDDEHPIFWVSGACMFVRSGAFWQAGGLDADYFAHQEEIDLCWRLHHLGHQVYYTPAARVYHVGGATLQADNPQKTYLNFRNSLFTLLKNLPVGWRLPVIFTRLCLDGLAGIRFLGQGRPKHLWAVLRAHVSFYSQWKKMNRKRQRSDFKNYSFVKSIVYLYFLRKKHYFSCFKNEAN